MIVNIPLRPIGFKTTLDDNEQNCIVCYVLFSSVGVTRIDAFTAFVLPYMMDAKRMMPTKTTVKNYAKLFFERPEVIEYEETYRDVLKAFLSGKDTFAGQDFKEKRMSIKDTLFEKARNAIEAEVVDPDTMTKVTTVLDKIGIFDEEEVQVEPPRRYVPVMCSECLYKSAIDKAVSEGQGEDECIRCRYRLYAEQHDVFYPRERMLIPKEDSAGTEKEKEV